LGVPGDEWTLFVTDAGVDYFMRRGEPAGVGRLKVAGYAQCYICRKEYASQ
jgi:hypothetical protein